MYNMSSILNCVRTEETRRLGQVRNDALWLVSGGQRVHNNDLVLAGLEYAQERRDRGNPRGNDLVAPWEAAGDWFCQQFGVPLFVESGRGGELYGQYNHGNRITAVG
jgi:hypothetical protein